MVDFGNHILWSLLRECSSANLDTRKKNILNGFYKKSGSLGVAQVMLLPLFEGFGNFRPTPEGVAKLDTSLVRDNLLY